MKGDIELNIAYVRVSSLDQNEERQFKSLRKYKIEKWFCEKASAKDTNRKEFTNMMEFAREGDTIFIHDFSRIARSTKNLLEIVENLKAKGIHLVSDKENIDTSTSTGKLMLTMIGAINEFERENLLERQREGIQIAKERGIYKGRQKVNIDNFEVYYNQYMAREINKVGLAKRLNISRPTLNRLIHEYESSIVK